MKRTFLFLLLCLPLLNANAQSAKASTSGIVYVKADGQGDGSSWESAASNLQQVLQQATPGQSIWVATGTYLPTSTTDRTISFDIPDGIQLYGGFAGFETMLEERDVQNNPTILSGNIGEVGIDDNSFSVIRTVAVSEATTIDGFTIAAGNANSKIKEGNQNSSGGGWFNDARQSASSPTIRNCVFEGNRAYFGAGLYNNAIAGTSKLLLEDCKFVANIAKFDGGAILNNGTDGQSNISIRYTSFNANEAYYGSSILNKAEVSGEANPNIKHVTFENNTAYMKGSPIYNRRTGEGVCNPIMVSCISTNNQESVAAPESSDLNRISEATKKAKRTIRVVSTYNK